MQQWVYLKTEGGLVGLFKKRELQKQVDALTDRVQKMEADFDKRLQEEEWRLNHELHTRDVSFLDA